MKFLHIIVYTFILSISYSQSQQTKNADDKPQLYSFPNTEVCLLPSKTNDVEYKLYISTPPKYHSNPAKSYPVLYLLDADYSFALAKNMIDHLAEREHIKEIIIIGIAYGGPNKYRIHRTRDYTPTNSAENVWFTEIQNKYSGGGSQFAAFLQNELIPYIDENFRATKFRVLTGHSYGGLFTTWTLLTKPHLFNGYIAVSPSLWYDEHLLFKINENLSAYSGEKLKVYLSVGDQEVNQNWNMPADLKRFVQYLQAFQNSEVQIEHDVRENETHNSVFPSALSNGLRFVFDGI